MQLRIVYFVHTFPLLTETFIYREVAALRARGCDVVVFSIRRPKYTEISAEARAFLHHTRYILPLSTWRLVWAHVRTVARYPLRYWRILWAVLRGTHERPRDRLRSLFHFAEAVTVLRAVEDTRPHHLHAHWAVGPATCALVASRFLGLRFSITAHAYDIWRDRLLLPEKLRAAEFVITCTDYNRHHLERCYGIEAAKCRVIHHGVDIARLRPVGRSTTQQPLVLSVGRLVEQKGFDRLIRACAALRTEGAQFRCDIVGDGPLRERLQGLVREFGLSEVVYFTGQLLHEQVIERYAAANIFVLVCVRAPDNDRDGIPNTLMEAMAMELPVVSTRFSGIPELVEDGSSGVLVDPEDTAGLVAVLRDLVHNERLRSELGRAGRERIREYFTIERSAALVHAAFADLYRVMND